MDVRDGAAAWEALASRDSCSRDAAMEHIEQEVKRKVESIGPIPKTSSSSLSSLLLSSCPGNAQDLNCALARVLMLSKRCPYEDVRERCIWLLRGVQVRKRDVAKKERWKEA
ncbi:sestrin-1 isoform X1 [Tachysurus ichikawai]